MDALSVITDTDIVIKSAHPMSLNFEARVGGWVPWIGRPSQKRHSVRHACSPQLPHSPKFLIPQHLPTHQCAGPGGSPREANPRPALPGKSCTHIVVVSELVGWLSRASPVLCTRLEYGLHACALLDIRSCMGPISHWGIGWQVGSVDLGSVDCRLWPSVNRLWLSVDWRGCEPHLG